MKKRHSIAWFGLSADPPTLGHRHVVEEALKSQLFDTVIVFPAGKLPYKKFQASDEERLAMLKLWKKAAGFGKNVILSDFELKRKKANAWIDLWHMVNRLLPGVQHTLVLGSDQFRSIEKKWVKGKDLLGSATFFVVERTRKESSTKARAGQLSQVDELVKKYILRKKLYKP